MAVTRAATAQSSAAATAGAASVPPPAAIQSSTPISPPPPGGRQLSLGSLGVNVSVPHDAPYQAYMVLSAMSVGTNGRLVVVGGNSGGGGAAAPEPAGAAAAALAPAPAAATSGGGSSSAEAADIGAATLNAANDMIGIFGNTPLSTYLAKCALPSICFGLCVYDAVRLCAADRESRH